MKIWIFNVLVAGALAYLFLGESEQTRVKSDLEWAKDKVETTIENNRSDEDEAAPRAEVRQMLGRPGERWGAESGTDRLVVIRHGG